MVRAHVLQPLGDWLNWLEHLPCTQRVKGSSPLSSTIYVCLLKFGRRGHIANVLGRFRREGSNPSANAIYWSVAQFGRAFGLGPRGRRFKSCRSNHYRTLTQLVECCADIAVAIGSNPIRPTILVLTSTIGCVIIKLFKEIISALTRLTNYLHRECNPEENLQFSFFC